MAELACVTYGTPHEGSAFAEVEDELVASFVALRTATAATGGVFANLRDILGYRKRANGFPGISDLRPPTGGGTFILELDEAEGFKKPVPVFAIGGEHETDRRAVRQILKNKLIGPNDVVVESRSSIPRFSAEKAVTRCNHFEYFDDASAAAHRDAAAFVHNGFALPMVKPRVKKKSAARPR